MANPFTTGPFNCCTCPEPPDYDPDVDDPLNTYVNLCGCPSVAVVCESEEKTATLCGFNEIGYDHPGHGVEPSVPPKRYLVRVRGLTRSINSPYPCDFYYAPTTTTATYSSDTCSLSRSGPIYSKYYGDTPSCPAGGIINTFVDGLDPAGLINATYTNTSILWSTTLGGNGTETRSENLNTEDTESSALARATATSGTSCSSLYQLRTTSFSFTKRTSTYTATASNLVIGVQYEGCVRIRRREAYSGTVPSGADTAWYDVEPDTIAAFTATDTEEEVATDVALPNAQGYEYEVVGAYVWPVSAGCDCPTSYVAP
jgi:hypothetical protein